MGGHVAILDLDADHDAISSVPAKPQPRRRRRQHQQQQRQEEQEEEEQEVQRKVRKRKFQTELTNVNSSSVVIPRLSFDRDKLNEYINEVEKAKKKGGTKTSREYFLIKHYNVVEIRGQKRLIKLGTYDPYVYYVHTDEIFDIINDAHRRVCHGGEKRTYAELKKNHS